MAVPDDTPPVTNILVDIDSLMDTRLPTLYALHKQTAIDVTSDESYHKRIRDTFGVIPHTVFNRFYSDRNKNILKLATPTPMIELLREYCTTATESIVSETAGTIPTLYINTYPYEFNREEARNLVELFFKILCTNPMNIELLYLNNEELTPQFVSTHMSTHVKYDMLVWLEYHNAIGALAKHPLTETTCVAPLIANGRKSSKDLTQEDFDNVRAMFGPMTNLVLLQSRIFSTT